MRRPYRHLLATSFFALFAAILQCGTAGCSDQDVDAGACAVDPPGQTFKLHVHNGGSKMLRLTYGCGSNLPVQLDTPMGMVGIGSGTCNLRCEDVYDGDATTVYPGCADCGPGMGDALGPGATADILWDRRVYVSHTVSMICGKGDGIDCALAEIVAPIAAQKGVLRVCADGEMPDPISGSSGFCSGDEQTFSFTIDTTGDEGTIEVQ